MEQPAGTSAVQPPPSPAFAPPGLTPEEAKYRSVGTPKHAPEWTRDSNDKLDDHPLEVQLELVTRRFLLFVACFSAFSIAFAIVFFYGIQVRDDVFDDVGSSTHSEKIITNINAASGFILEIIQVAVWMGVDQFYPVYEVYVHNLFFPDGSEEPDKNGDPVDKKSWSCRWRKVAVWTLPFVIMLAIQNSFKSFQASSKTVGFLAVMDTSDLRFNDAKGSNKLGNTSVSAMSVPVKDGSVRKTVLKNAVEQKTTPFIYDTTSNCTLKQSTATNTSGTSGTEEKVPPSVINVDEVDATSIVYGFVANEWNAEAIPQELKPVHQFNITPRTVKTAIAPAWLNMTLQFDLFLHAKAGLERVISAAAKSKYQCEWSESTNYSETTLTEVRSATIEYYKLYNDAINEILDGNGTAKRMRRRRLASTPAPAETDGDEFSLNFDETDSSAEATTPSSTGQPSDGMCYGAISTLANFGADYKDPTKHTLPVLLDHVFNGIDQSMIDVSVYRGVDANRTFENFTWDTMLDKSATTVDFEQYQLTPKIRVDAMRMDVALHDELLIGSHNECVMNRDQVPCNSSVMTYADYTMDMCGSGRCLFVDDGIGFKLRKQVVAMPYMQHCNPNSALYNKLFRMYTMPSCTPVNHSMVVIGIGSYLTAAEFGNSWRNRSMAYLVSPRRHYRISVARISWEMSNLDQVFDVNCAAGDCSGLAYKLEQTGRFLFAGKDALSMDRLNRASFQQPISLVQLQPARITIKIQRVENFSCKATSRPSTQTTWLPTRGKN